MNNVNRLTEDREPASHEGHCYGGDAGVGVEPYDDVDEENPHGTEAPEHEEVQGERAWNPQTICY